MTTHVHSSDEAQWAVGMGAKLRMMQASLADDDPSARSDYLREEIEREIRGVPDSRRKGYLEALADRFPQGEGGGANAGVLTAPQAPADESAQGLVRRLAALARDMPEDERDELSSQLRNAGFTVEVRVGGAAERDEIPVELQKKLSLDPNQALDRKRAIRLVSVLIDLVVTMDQVGWNVWRSLASDSRVRREPGPGGDLRRIAGPFLTGDPEVNLAQVTDLLGKTRQLIAGLMAALGAAGKIFAAQHLTRFAPGAIEEEANKEPGFFVGPEQKCWRKYKTIFSEINGAVIEQEISNIIVRYTEDLILGAGRPEDGPGADG